MHLPRCVMGSVEPSATVDLLRDKVKDYNFFEVGCEVGRCVGV